MQWSLKHLVLYLQSWVRHPRKAKSWSSWFLVHSFLHTQPLFRHCPIPPAECSQNLFFESLWSLVLDSAPCDCAVFVGRVEGRWILERSLCSHFLALWSWTKSLAPSGAWQQWCVAVNTWMGLSEPGTVRKFKRTFCLKKVLDSLWINSKRLQWLLRGLGQRTSVQLLCFCSLGGNPWQVTRTNNTWGGIRAS